MTSSNLNVGTISTSPVSLSSGVSSATTQFNALAVGNTTLTAAPPAGYSTPAASGNVLTASVNSAGLVPANATVGLNLETTANVILNGAAPSGGLVVAVTSNDAGKLLLSTTPDGAGSASISLTVPAGLSHTQDFYVQGLAGSGTVTYTASAGSGFGSANGTVTLTPGGILVAGPAGFGNPVLTTTGSSSTTITAYSAQLDSSGNFTAVQQVRGGLSATVNVTSSNTTVGTINPSPVTIAGGSFNVTTEFQPLSAGNTTLSVNVPAGFSTPAQFTSVPVTVGTPRISVTDGVTIGQTLETSGSVVVGQLAPSGGLVITLTSNDPSRLLLSATATDAGSSSLTVTIPAGSNNTSFYLQAFGNPAAVTYTASAPGFQSGSGTVQVTPSGVVLAGPFGIAFPFPFSTTTTSSPTNLTAFAAQLDGSGNFVSTQQLAGGLSLPVSLTSSNTGVATVTPQVTIAGGSDNAVAQFTPKGVGSATISVVTPPGYTGPPTTYTSTTGNVTQ